jgi:hypothetical protein
MGSYIMPIARKHLPCPLMEDGSGGGGTRASSPPSHLPRRGGKGYVPTFVNLMAISTGGPSWRRVGYVPTFVSARGEGLS